MEAHSQFSILHTNVERLGMEAHEATSQLLDLSRLYSKSHYHVSLKATLQAATAMGMPK